jgi:hypothetical protein
LCSDTRLNDAQDLHQRVALTMLKMPGALTMLEIRVALTMLKTYQSIALVMLLDSCNRATASDYLDAQFVSWHRFHDTQDSHQGIALAVLKVRIRASL